MSSAKDPSPAAAPGAAFPPRFPGRRDCGGAATRSSRARLRKGTIGSASCSSCEAPQRRRYVEETAMNWLRNRLIWGAMLVSLAGALAACEEGPAEDAGEVIDEQGEEAVD